MAEQNTRFREHIAGFFYDLIRAAGITMPPGNSFQRVRDIGERMARTIEAAAETKAIEVIKRLQKAILVGFDKMEKELNTLKVQSVNHNDLIGNLLEEQKKQAEEIERLIARVIGLESIVDLPMRKRLER